MTLIAQLTDLHICQGGEPAYGRVDTLSFLRRAVDHLNAFVPALDGVIVSGDLVDAGVGEEYKLVRAELDRLTAPYLPIPGNHDGPDFWDVFADRLPGAERRVGATARIGAVDLILFDSTIPGRPPGLIDDARAAFLARSLGNAGPSSLLVMHHPPVETGIAHMDEKGVQEAHRLDPILTATPPLAILCGHIHRTIFARRCGVPVIVAPSPAHAVSLDLRDEGPPTFHMDPPGVMIHRLKDDALVSHVSFIGDFDGPHPFFGAQAYANG